jgi:tricorn protease
MRYAPALCVLVLGILAVSVVQAGQVGYYRQPALTGNTLLFVAEGDLWKVSIEGGVARRLTSHPGDESTPTISPDGRTVAFVGQYEGPSEVYTISLDGGVPTRHTFGAAPRAVVGWTPDGRVLFSSNVRSTLPSTQLMVLDVSHEDVTGLFEPLPLAQAADGNYDDSGNLFFTRFPFQGSHTKRYRGGTAQSIWRYADGDEEASQLTSDFPGTSRRPWWWQGRIYFVSDRDGSMNLWSMGTDGSDLRQHSQHSGWDAKSPYLSDGKIVYQRGADIHLYDIEADEDRPLSITLDTDLDQLREHWVSKPIDYLSSAHLSPDGERLVLTARGRVFVAPRKQGRLVEATRDDGVRYRNARFLPDGKGLLILSDRSGEVEFWSYPANGVGEGKQLTTDGDMLRWNGMPSPDGKYVAHHDKRQRLFVLDVEGKQNRKIAESSISGFGDLAWSPDGRWLAYVETADNLFSQIRLHDVQNDRTLTATTDRYDSYSPTWSPDGKWLYLLSDRNLKSIVESPWGNYQPEPFLDEKTRIYQLALTEGLRSPFAPKDELHPGKEKKDEDKSRDKEDDKDSKDKRDVEVLITEEGLQTRLIPVPVDPGNYGDLVVTKDALYWRSTPAGEDESELKAVKIGNEEIEVKTVAKELDGYEISADGKMLLLRKKKDLYIVKAEPKEAKLKKRKVDLSAWTLSVNPREEWRQMFVEAWRLERDYFYDRGMHGVDWPAMLEKYRPLAERVTTRAELSDLIAQLVSELSALHIYVYGGEMRKGPEDVQVASLGATLVRDAQAGGYRVEHIYASDPDEPDLAAPLAKIPNPVEEGAVIESINGVPTLSVADAGMLLRGTAGQQVLLHVDDGKGRDVIVTPISAREERNLRYHQWEHTRRLQVEEMGEGEIGYVHLRAMNGRNFTEWAKGFYPVYNRKGLIIDVRHNRGGNIDSWILARLLRKAWYHWNQPVGWAPVWNMQYAFRGHVIVLCDERTASDGEIFAEGIKRLGIGELIGTRTWGGEIWLSSNNFLVDGGIATSAEYGVYGPEGEWLIEGYGVDPDVVVDNLPHAAFLGKDAQLEEAIRRLKERIATEPLDPPLPPPFPDKSFSEAR